MNVTKPAVAAPLWRRLAALLYDTLIVIALLMFATAIVLPLNQGNAFDSGNLWLQAYLLITVLGFFLLFWRKGGQTLGMRAWKIKLVGSSATHSQQLSTQLAPPGYISLLIRAGSGALGVALFGIGLWWCLFDKEKRALHDRLSNTWIIMHLPAN